MSLKPVLTRPVLAILAVLGALFALDLFAIGASRNLDQAIVRLQEEAQTQAVLAGLPHIILGIPAL